jgi:hypothetical protein
VGVQVDEAGQRDQAIGIDLFRLAGTPCVTACRGDQAIADQQIRRRTLDDPHARDQETRHFAPPSRW